jgi:polyphenol oxidase
MMFRKVRMGLEFKRKGLVEKLEVHNQNGVVYLTFPILSAYSFITHGFSTRMGGVSKGIYASMNLGLSRGDDETSVRENFSIIAKALQISCEDMVFSDQTHTANVRVVTEKDRGNGLSRPKDFFDIDGMVTNVPGLVLTTFYADCVPLFFVDPVNKAIGLSHSGWHGTVDRIGEATIKKMKEEYGTKAEDVVAAIGPSICGDCYEISQDVAMEFKNKFSYEDINNFLFTKGNEKYQLDLWKANELILLEAGVKSKNIEVTDICTCCNPEFLFSHRASNGKRGNLAAFLTLTE